MPSAAQLPHGGVEVFNVTGGRPLAPFPKVPESSIVPSASGGTLGGLALNGYEETVVPVVAALTTMLPLRFVAVVPGSSSLEASEPMWRIGSATGWLNYNA